MRSVKFRCAEKDGEVHLNYVGIDHHRQYSHITWLDEKGEVVKSGRVGNLGRELEEFLQGARDVKAVIEARRSS